MDIEGGDLDLDFGIGDDLLQYLATDQAVDELQ